MAIRAKGNTSLTQVEAYENDRYSFKIEFDHYDSSNTYHGFDKLCLNNMIQDNTYMKDYLTYQMMSEMGVASPLCSYVNNETWGLYLAVEGVAGSFLRRNYGNDHRKLYKPDSMDMGGGRGNGKDFDMDGWEGFGEYSRNIEAEVSGSKNPETGNTETYKTEAPALGGSPLPDGAMQGNSPAPDGMMQEDNPMPGGSPPPGSPSGGLPEDIGGMPQGVPDAIAGGMTDGEPVGAPGSISDEAPQGIPDGAPQDMPDGMPQDIPDGTPGSDDVLMKLPVAELRGISHSFA